MRIRTTFRRYPPALLILFGLVSLGYGLFLLLRGWISAGMRIAFFRPRIPGRKKHVVIEASREEGTHNHDR